MSTVRGDAVVVRGDAPAPRYNTMNVVRCDASNYIQHFNTVIHCEYGPTVTTTSNMNRLTS